jgi:lipoprotein-anchoring transpeptidase ErfK/SrfK
VTPRVVLLIVLCLVAAGCGSSHPRAVATQARRCTAGSVHPLGSARTAYAAVAVRRLSAFRSPGSSRLATYGTLNQNGVPTVFGVIGASVRKDCTPRWYRVELPQRPNGASGWVRAADVELAAVHTRIIVDLSARRLTFFRDGRPRLTTTVAIGAPATPTPTGRYYVNQRLVPRDTTGPYGPAAIGVSAFSNVLTGWTQGGPIAIHGTDDPSSIGHAASNGCIRANNAVVRRLFGLALAGTPVIIRA